METDKYHDLMSSVKECIRQQGSAEDVLNLYMSLGYLRRNTYEIEITERLVKSLYTSVSGETVVGYRSMPATFRNGPPALAPKLIPNAMESLLKHQDHMSAYEFTHEFLKIHAGRDYNGRVAWLLFNLLNWTLLRPLPLPKFTF